MMVGLESLLVKKNQNMGQNKNNLEPVVPNDNLHYKAIIYMGIMQLC